MAGITAINQMSGIDELSKASMVLTKEEIDTLIDQYNPYPSVRNVQRLAIHQIIEAYQAGEKLVECSMPTASGKTLVLTIVSKILAFEFGLDMVLTTTPLVALADQYANNEHYKDVPTLIGKSNYPCNFDSSLTAADCPFTGSKKMKRLPPVCAKCEYRAAKERFADSPIGYTTFDRMHYDPKINSRMEVLLIDESTSIENKLREYNTLELPNNINDNNLPQWLENHYHELLEKIDKLENELEETADMYQLTKESFYRKKMKELNGKITKARQELYSTGKAIYYIKKGVRYLITIDTVDKYNRDLKREVTTSVKHFKLLTAEVPFEDLVKNLKFVVLASGTPATQLLVKKPFKKIAVEHPIPVTDRPAIFYPVGSMNYDSRNKTAEKMAPVIAALFKDEKHNVIVHCGSYPIADILYKELVKYVNKDEIILQTKKTRREALGKFLGAEHMLYLSVEMAEGIDLIGEKFKVNIIAKRFAHAWKDPYTTARNTYDKQNKGFHEWYEVSTSIHMMQAYGRTTRKPGDESKTYFLDADCFTFWKWYNSRSKRKLFYNWFDEAVIVDKKGDLLPEL